MKIQLKQQSVICTMRTSLLSNIFVLDNVDIQSNNSVQLISSRTNTNKIKFMGNLQSLIAKKNKKEKNKENALMSSGN